ncbi:hypothetical protein PG993_012436 [Apiospora rasikravindrae]|uniref:NACHT domain-containing protein n=1 Tax=Apiospora rasikravindrae TaxID=990691 RepID=A0ABR1S2L0_9PEZI
MSDIVLNRAIERFRQSLTDEQKQLFTASSLDNVNAEIQSIQARHGSTKKLRNLSRISKFLEAMAQLEQLVQIFLNVSEVVAFVWGPIKLALMPLKMAGTRVQTLEQLLDTYVEIGEVIPGLRQYEAIFKQAPTVLEVLEKYFCDILEFHRNAMDVFARPGWKACFDSTWKTFRSRFNPIMESLKRHRALLLDERLNAAVLGIRDGRDQTLQLLKNTSDQSSTNFDQLRIKVDDVYTELSSQVYGLAQSSEKLREELQRDLPIQEMSSMLTKLDLSDYKTDQQAALTSCHGESGTWIFQSPSFSNWMQSRALPDCALFIYGMPGAGKTSLAARIIDHLSAQPGPNHSSLLYFFFKNADNKKRSMSHMLRALLAQLVRQDASLAHILYEKCCLVSTAEAQTLSTLKSWTAELLKTQARCTIILDGLDECNHHGDGMEAKRILEWFLKSIIPDCLEQGSDIRLLGLSQRDGVVDQALWDYSYILLDDSPLHLDDVRSFTKARAFEIANRFPLDLGEEEVIVQKVISISRSMFLYVKIVMDNLMAQGSAAELDEELNVNFPKGLDEAYERVAFRIFDHPSRSQSRREAASQILKWLTCAVRPLRWREIQSLFCINPHNATCNSKNRRVDNCKCICGSFVEIDQSESGMIYLDGTDPVVSLVHDTARRYLIHSGRVILPEANASMTIFSSTYLASLPFKADFAADALENALSGYFGLLDYSVSSWQEHLELCLEHCHELSPSTLHNLQRAVLAILQRFDFNEIPESFGDNLESARKVFDTACLKHCILRLERISTPIRKVVENIDPTVLDGRAGDVFFSLSGKQQFKCPKPRCFKFSEGFESKEARDRHVTQHYAPFTCSVGSCPRGRVGFLSRAGLNEHTREAHASLTNKPTDLFPTAKEAKDPLYDACARGDIQAIKVAAENGHADLCRYFALNSTKLLWGGSILESLYAAIGSNDVNMFRVLTEAATPEQTQQYVNSTSFEMDIGTGSNNFSRKIFDMLLSMNSSRSKPLSYAEIFIKGVIQNNMRDNGSKFDQLLRRMDENSTKLKSESSDSPFYKAIRELSIESIQLLLEHGFVNEMGIVNNRNGDRPLHHACRSRAGEGNIVKLLLPYSMDHLDDPNGDGETPLHIAVKRGLVGVTKALLDTGAVDPYKRDGSGRTAFEMAKKPGVQSLFRSASGEAGIPMDLPTDAGASAPDDPTSVET